jgi:hypothetical protein
MNDAAEAFGAVAASAIAARTHARIQPKLEEVMSSIVLHFEPFSIGMNRGCALWISTDPRASPMSGLSSGT